MEKLQARAKELLADYEALQEARRAYDGHAWHAVNVKRHNDYIDIDAITENPGKYKQYFYSKDQDKTIKKYSDAIREQFTEDYVGNEYGLYDNWLEFERDQLRYKIDDIAELVEGRQSFQYITVLEQGHKNAAYKNNYIYFLGRSGGWACFQDDAGSIAEELVDALENPDYTAQDIDGLSDELAAAIEEINYLKQFIKKYNDNLEFDYEIFFRIAEFTEELDAEAEKQAEDRPALLQDLTSHLNAITSRLNQFKADKKLTASISRNIKSIKAIIEKNL